MSSKNHLPFVIFVIAAHTVLAVNSATSFSCGQGTYRQGARGCASCSEGTFMDEFSHNFTKCMECQTPQEHLFEYETEKCTRIRNTRILCTKSHYRLDYPPEPALGECFRCSVCGVGKAKSLKVLILPCGDYTDTLCCESTEFQAQMFVDTLGRMFLQCVQFPVATRLDIATSALHANNSAGQHKKCRDNTPSSGMRLTSTTSANVPLFWGLLCLFMCECLIPWNE